MDKKGITKILTGMLFLSPLVSEAWKYSTYVEELRWKDVVFTDKIKGPAKKDLKGESEENLYEGSRSQTIVAGADTFKFFVNDGEYNNGQQKWKVEEDKKEKGKGVRELYRGTGSKGRLIAKGNRCVYYKNPTIYVTEDDPKKCAMQSAFYHYDKDQGNKSVWLDINFKDVATTIPAVPLFFPLSTKGAVGDIPGPRAIFNPEDLAEIEARADEPCLDFSNTPIVHIDLGSGKATYKGKEIDAQQSIEFYMLPETVSEVCFHPAMALHHAGLLQDDFSSIEYEFSFAGDMTTKGIKNWPDDTKTMSLIDGAYKGPHVENKLTAHGLSKVSCSGSDVMTFAPSSECEYHNGDTIGTTGVLLTGKMPKEDILRTMVVYNKDGAQKAFVSIHVFLPHATAMAMIKEICTGQLDGTLFTALDKPADELKAMVQILEKIKDDGAALPDNYDRVIEMVKWYSEDKDPFGDGTDKPKAKPKPKGEPVDFDKLTAEEIEKMSADRLNEVLNQYRDLKGGKGLEVVDAIAIADLEGKNELTDDKTSTDYDGIIKKVGKGVTDKKKIGGYLQARLAVNDLLKDGKEDNLNAAREKLRNLLGLKKPAGGGGGGDAIDFSQLPADSDIKTKFDGLLNKDGNKKLKDAAAKIEWGDISDAMGVDKYLGDKGLAKDDVILKEQLSNYIGFLQTLKSYATMKNLDKVKDALTTLVRSTVWTEDEIEAEIDKTQKAFDTLKGKHPDFDKAFQAVFVGEKATKNIDAYVASLGGEATAHGDLIDQLWKCAQYRKCMNKAAKQADDNIPVPEKLKGGVPPPPPPPPPPPGGKSQAQVQVIEAQDFLAELAALLGATLDPGEEHHDTPAPTDGVWQRTDINTYDDAVKANYDKFIKGLKDGDFKTGVDALNEFDWSKADIQADIDNYLKDKTGELKTQLEAYVACKKAMSTNAETPPPPPPPPSVKEEPFTEKTEKQKAIEAANDALQKLQNLLKGGTGGGGGTPPGMTAEAAKAEIANAENALKAAFGNDAAWENIANGTTINWTADDAAVQAAINLQPANLQPKLKAYYEYHKLVQEVLNDKISGAEREAKLKDLQEKIEGWKATLSKKDEEHHEDDAALLTGACGPETWTKEQIAKGVTDLTKALGDILSANADLKSVRDSIDWKKDDLSKKIEEVADETLRSKVEAYVVARLWSSIASANGEQKIQIPSDTDPKVMKDSAIYLAQRNLGVAQIGLQKLRELLGEPKVVTALDTDQGRSKDEFLQFVEDCSKEIALLNLPEAVSENERQNFAKEIDRAKLRISMLRIIAGAMSGENYDGLSGTLAAGLILKQTVKEYLIAAKMAYKLTEDQKNALNPFAAKEKQAEDGIAQLRTEVQKWNDEGKPQVDITAQSKIIADNKKQLDTVYETLYNGFDYDDCLAKVTEYSNAQEQALQAAKDAFQKVSDEYNSIPEGVRTAIEKHNKTINGWDTQRNQFVTALGSINDDGIADEFKSSIADSKAKAQKALEDYNAEIASIQNVLKTAKTEEALNGIEDRINAIRSQLEDDKEGSLKDLMKKAQDAMDKAKEDTERAKAEKEEAEKVQKTIAALKQCEQALLEGLGKLKTSAQKRSKTAVVNALSVAELCVQLHELLWSDTTKTVSKVVAQAEFEEKVQAIENARKGITSTFGDDTFSGGTQSPIPTYSGGYESGNPSLYQTYSGPTPQRNRRQSPTPRNGAYSSSSSGSKSGALSRREREREARRRAVYRR